MGIEILLFTVVPKLLEPWLSPTTNTLASLRIKAIDSRALVAISALFCALINCTLLSELPAAPVVSSIVVQVITGVTVP